MGRDRTEVIGARTGLAGLVDRIRYKEIYRQALGLLLIAVCAWLTAPGGPWVLAGLLIALAGQLFRIFAAGTIFKNRKLASSGAYALVRHPLYLGNFLILFGFGLACANPLVIAVLVIFWLVWYPAAIRYEDRKLEQLFGEPWREWSRGTNAVLPKSLDFARLTATQWSAHQSLIRNGELYITVYLAACAWWLWSTAWAG